MVVLGLLLLDVEERSFFEGTVALFDLDLIVFIKNLQ